MDILIRNVPKDLIDRIDENAKKRGLSRQEFLLNFLLDYDLETKIKERQDLLLEIIQTNSNNFENIGPKIDNILKILRGDM